MARKTQIDRAIAKIDDEIAQLQAIRARLVSVQTSDKPKRKPKADRAIPAPAIPAAPSGNRT